MRHFHSYGPVDPEDHFCVPRTGTVDRCVQQLLGDPNKGGHYFTIWAPRQTGKTWIMRRALAEIRARYSDRFVAGTFSMQGVVMDANEPAEAFLKRMPTLLHNAFKLEVAPPASWESFQRLFSRSEQVFQRPVILLIDEFDKLPSPVIDRLVNLFRDIYLDRENYLLHGLALVGVRAVLGVDSPRGSPFNVQRSLHVPNLTADEVTEMFRQYQAESAQPVDKQVVDRIYEVTRGQPGLVGWFGELLTEKYNPTPTTPITMKQWDYAYGAACQVEPNNTVLNLLKKARHEPYREHVVQLFSQANIPFSFDSDWCSHLYLNGVIDYQEVMLDGGQLTRVCRFTSPFIQLRLYNAFTSQQGELGGRVPVVDLRDDLTPLFAAVDLAALLERYQDYLRRLKHKGINPWQGQPRRADLHLTEAVGHFHLYWWLVEACKGHLTISPEFPTGNGKVDLHVRGRQRAGLIEVKSFTQRSDLPLQKAQVARYARSRGLAAAVLAVFAPTEDEDLLKELSGQEVVEGVDVTTIAIAAA